MNRRAFILLLAVMLPLNPWASPALAASFDTASAASVWGAALSYISPRALDPLSIPQMTIWGLNGLAALDPDLNATLQDSQIRLYGPEQLIIALPAPAATDPTGWGHAAAQVANAAYATSPALRLAGTQGIIDSFFDELFNHFDPYSRYEPPLQAAQDQLMITGVAGTGLVLARQDNKVVVGSVAADSPAFEAGITAGAVVLALDNHPAYPSHLVDLNSAQSGVLNSHLTLRVQDPGAPGDVTSINLTRALVPPQTVFDNTQAQNIPNVLVLKITGFNKGTSDQFSAALVAALAAHPTASGLILDLRGNRGGVLRQAVLIADTLLTHGDIVTAAGRDPDADQAFAAEGSDLTNGLPLVVLVDGQTASAAEILSAALADNRRAVVVGSATLGKGLVQTVTALPDGGELYVTWSRVLAPRGWPLQTLGVLPQLCTSLGEATLESELNALYDGKNLLAPALLRSRAARAPLPVDKVLSIRNNCPADIGGALDFTAAEALMNSPAAYKAALIPAIQ